MLWSAASRAIKRMERRAGCMGWLRAWGVWSWMWVFCVELGYLCGRFAGTHEVVSEVAWLFLQHDKTGWLTCGCRGCSGRGATACY